MDKKGALTSSQIIILVLAIAGFLIVLAALFLVDLGGYSAEDTCKLSVLTRATAPLGEKYIPLKCIAKKICIRDSFIGGCKDEFRGEEDVEYVRLKGSDSDKARIIEEVTANAMYDCWSMMGEGKLDLFKGGLYESLGLDAVESTCVVCSRIVVDKNVNKDIIKLVNMRDYMQSHQIPGQSLTYLQKFTDRGVSAYASVNQNELDALSTRTIEGDASGNQLAIVFMQIKSEEWGDAMAKLGVTALAGGFAISKVPILGKVVRMLFTAEGLVVAAVGAAVATGVTYVNTAAGQANAAGYCGGFTSPDEAAKGCSVMQAIDYNFRDISNICKVIEGEL